MDIPPQANFFFEGKWSAELDDHLLSTLVSMKEQQADEQLGITDEALVAARAKVEAVAGISFSIDELKARVVHLGTRYETFNAIVSTTGVWWYPHLKVVDACDNVWGQLIKGNPFAAAYYYEDEPEYRRLTTLFGLVDVKQESTETWKVAVPTELVVLSDTTIPPPRCDRPDVGRLSFFPGG